MGDGKGCEGAYEPDVAVSVYAMVESGPRPCPHSDIRHDSLRDHALSPPSPLVSTTRSYRITTTSIASIMRSWLGLWSLVFPLTVLAMPSTHQSPFLAPAQSSSKVNVSLYVMSRCGDSVRTIS